MTANEFHTTPRGAMQHMINSTGKSRIALSKELGRGDTYVTSAIQKKSTKVDTITELAKVCGYELLLRGQDTEIVIDPPDKEDE